MGAESGYESDTIVFESKMTKYLPIYVVSRNGFQRPAVSSFAKMQGSFAEMQGSFAEMQGSFAEMQGYLFR